MTIVTGFGYFVKDGKKVSKYELKPGTHPDPLGMSFVEVSSKAELDGIILDKTDEQILAEQQYGISLKIKANREAFIDALISGDTGTQEKIKASHASLKAQVKE